MISQFRFLQTDRIKTRNMKLMQKQTKSQNCRFQNCHMMKTLSFC